jgi:hypothetical protein
MTSLSVPALLCGGPAYMPHSTELKAGPLSMVLEQGELRRIRLGDTEVVRRIYLTLRGPDWSTVAPSLGNLDIEAGPDAFALSFTLTYRQGPFDFTWSVTASGNREGTLGFHAKGRAVSDFATNRVGLCLLHPPRECAGKPVRLSGPEGDKDASFPILVSPREPLTEYRAIAFEPGEGVRVRLVYEGDVCETEDQRNWTDGSFKTYSPPQSRPKPRQVAAGWETAAGVTLELLKVPSAPQPAASVTTLAFAELPSAPLPAWGFGLPSHGLASGPVDRKRLQALAPAHLRVNLRLSQPGHEALLAFAAGESMALGAPLEAAVVVAAGFATQLAALAEAWRGSGARPGRWLIFSENAGATPEEILAAALEHLGPLNPGAAFAMGSDSDFVLVNRGFDGRVLPTGAAPVYAMTPQVHLQDNRTLVESLEGQEWTLRTACSKWPGPAPVVSPVTLKRSPFALALKRPAGSPDPAAWRAQADTRQLSIFGAGWTIGSFSVLAAEGASAATFYETSGSLGVLAGETCGLPERSFSGSDLAAEAGWVFPLYHVFADLAEFRGGEVLPMASSHPLRVRGFGLRSGSRRAVLLANLEGIAGRLHLELPSAPIALRRLNSGNAMRAIAEAEAWRRESRPPASGSGGKILDLDLAPYESIRIDF